MYTYPPRGDASPCLGEVNEMRFNNNEEAVSPVIGVILMVAITVILAAVIAVFVFGMASDVQTTKTVAATAKQSGTDIIVTYQGGPDASKVDAINVTVYKADGSPYDATKKATGSALASAGTPLTANGQINWSEPAPGYTMTIGSVGTSGQERVVITSMFDDGTTQVLLDKLV